ncbi:hypothetical protein R6Q57_003694 [Mikania cordata]
MAKTEPLNQILILHITGFQPSFSSFMQPCIQQTAPQSRHEPDFVSTDVVLKTQEPQIKEEKRKRTKEIDSGGPSSGPMAPKPWTHDEETVLGRCYINHSENKTKETVRGV